ncbi:hypothetical protein BDZ91DRAFT_739050 [Kalaharituber pfeilii]|nr:hypothetical protein BDZ91DRAFT_739050 [Kalaharituber pfeilii]
MVAAAASTTEVPVIDFAPFLHGTDDERKATGTALFEAMRDVGFAYLVNHGVDKETIKDGFKMSRAFFDMPLEDKLKSPHPPDPRIHRGYAHIGQEKLSLYPDALNTGNTSTTPPSIPVFENKESMDLGHPKNPLMANIYPPPGLLPGFVETAQKLFDVLYEFGLIVLRAIAIGLRLDDEDFFSQFHGGKGKAVPMNQLRLLHYPAVTRGQMVKAKRELEGGFTRIIPHTDKGTLTLLLQEDDVDARAGTLEIEVQGGKYIPTPVIPGSILVNIGDLMQWWSNDVLRSTRHRVGLPDVGAVDGEDDNAVMVQRRFSIPYFVSPDADAEVDCLDSEMCWSIHRPKRYGRDKAWDVIMRSMTGAY